MNNRRYIATICLSFLCLAYSLHAPRIRRHSPLNPRNASPMAHAPRSVKPDEENSFQAIDNSSPELVASLFGWNPRPRSQPQHSNEIEPSPLGGGTPKPAIIDWIRHTGEIESDFGRSYYFFKDAKTGVLFKVRKDGAEEDGISLKEINNEFFVLVFDGSTISIPRR